MDCCALSTATSYAIKPLYEAMRHTYKATIYRDVLHLMMERNGHTFQAFFFPYGVAVFWGITRETALKIIQQEVQTFEENHTDELETDLFTYTYGDTAKIVEDEIVLPNEDVLTKLAVSHGIAQSVELAAFESSLQKTFNSTKKIPEDLAVQG